METTVRNRTVGWWWWWRLIAASALALMAVRVEGQQSYVDNHQLDCYNHFNSTDGNVCNGVDSTCPSYLTFRSQPPYNTPTSIGYLLNSQPSQIAEANNVSDVDTFPNNSLILIPINCSCSSSFYQHNASYVLKIQSETYFSLANNTYQGLTTCQALMSQNGYGDRNLLVGNQILVPLRCACPTLNQTRSAYNFLLTYLVTWKDDIPSIADRFRVDPQAIWNANRLSSSDIIFPFTPLLIPLHSQPSAAQLSSPAPPPLASAPPPQSHSSSSKSSNNKWVFVGVGIGSALLLLLLALSAFLFCTRRRHKPKQQHMQKPKAASPLPSPPPPKLLLLPQEEKEEEEEEDFRGTKSVSHGVRHAIESISVYNYSDLQMATDSFSETNKIRGSVYKGVFMGDAAAVKMMKGDVSSEINILKRINHSNIIRLSGFCVHGGNTYLVYEYAENGSVGDWLQPTKCHHLSWKHRVQIAHDVADALNYLHHFTNPPHIHKNLNTSNILLDGSFRAKVSNFGLARTLEVEDDKQEEDDGPNFQLTRHVVGTHGYMAPEYIENGVITPKLDVFAFGVVILELLSGREATTTRRGGEGQQELPLSESITEVLQGDNVRDKLKAFIDPSLKDEYPLDLAFSLAQLAKRCVDRHMNSRPAISEVYITLSKILSSSLDWDPSDELERSHGIGRSQPNA
ncbi:protein LYK5 [Ziziphus jujuba]|uniref:Protein LYK5 n=2 Tax=Ziziphus jujuba TaxID=326968 RepID=A0A6P3ZLV0_ZIZJJ|nr:protein LYK5 [Ziziphus jujuba]KAH7523343.1 hypothetical protein FEM48_Zijuj06G0000800 [Ziziphus jujuba var. spinosa]